MALRIEDYGLIGDCQTAALVGCDGSIDWLCFPRFDSHACFAALLGGEQNGRWLIAPQQEARVSRRYRPDTLILETEFRLSSGDVVRLIDFMPVRGEMPDLVRIVEGVRGEVSMRMELRPRFDYGCVTPWISQENDTTIAVAGPNRLALRTNVELHRDDGKLMSEFTVKAGQRRTFSLTWSESNRPRPLPVAPLRALRTTESWWKRWARACNVEGKWRDCVTRSLITLKALTYMPTGGIVAAATTSLPEQIGSVRNWDYRFCWLRDASFTLFSLMSCGYTKEAHEWMTWLLRATTGHPAELQVMYGVAGERMLTESTVKWLDGYENSKPVRIGNAATEQFQLDVFGEVLDAVHKWWSIRGKISEFGWTLTRTMVEFLEGVWRKPDEGIWEVRGPRRHFTHSKLMAWVAFDRAIAIAEKQELDCPLEKWKEIREEIRSEILEKAFNKDLNSFVQSYGSQQLDAATLRIPLVGFLPADDEMVKGTVAAIEKSLLVDGYLHRYQTASKVDGLPEGEGAFLMCTLWYADVLHMMGRTEESKSAFKRVMAIRNDLGLLSEMYDPKKKRLTGNFPQAFSHVGLVNTALRLSGRGDVPEKFQKPARRSKKR